MIEIVDIPSKVISEAYSADIICYSDRIKKPFEYRGKLYTTVGVWWQGYDGMKQADIIEVVDPSAFEGEILTYRTKEGTSYHGIAVKCGKNKYVMKGERIVVRASDTKQLNLFFGAES